MTKTQISFFNVAKHVSKLSDFPKVNVGAIVVNKHRIISSGCNSAQRTHRIQVEYNKKRFNEPSTGMLHAEISALLPLINKTDLSKADVYVYRELRNGNLGMSRPCKACMALIKELGIRKVFYTTNDGFAEEALK